MRIEIETNEMDDKDAAAIVGLLIVRYPSALSELMATAATLEAFTSGDPGVFTDDEARTLGVRVAASAAEEAFVPPADAAFTAPLDALAATGAAAADGTSTTEALAAAAAPPPAPAPLASVEVDADGLPWDARIHGEGKNKTKGGQWRKRRNLSADVEKAVTAELKAAMAAPPLAAAAAAPPLAAAAAAPTPPPAVAPPATQAEPVPTPAADASAAAAPPPPPAPVPPAPSAEPEPSAAPAAAAPAVPATDGAQPAVSGPTLFAAIMRKVTEAQTAGRITPELVTAACQAVGLTGVRDLLTRTDLIPAFEETFIGMCAPAAA